MSKHARTMPRIASITDTVTLPVLSDGYPYSYRMEMIPAAPVYRVRNAVTRFITQTCNRVANHPLTGPLTTITLMTAVSVMLAELIH